MNDYNYSDGYEEYDDEDRMQNLYITNPIFRRLKRNLKIKRNRRKKTPSSKSKYLLSFDYFLLKQK
jgi:hypothetical protein